MMNPIFAHSLFGNCMLLVGFLLLGVNPLSAQLDDVELKEMKAVFYGEKEYNHFRVVNDNDFWKPRGSTDRYYTNGVFAEYVSSRLDRLDRIFFKINGDEYINYYGLGLSQKMFTPIDITTTVVDSTDRPYAGWLFASIWRKSMSPTLGSALTFKYDIGVIGPAAQASDVQAWFHRVFGFDEPRGWSNQIPNDAGFNFYLRYEKRFERPVEFIDLIYLVEANLPSTVSNNFGVGSIFRVGFFNDYFSNPTGKYPGRKVRTALQEDVTYFNPRRVQVYGQITAIGRTVLDNSLLSGGLFSWRSSPYRIESDDLQHFLFEAEFKLVVAWHNVSVEYAQWIRTKEFKGAFDSRWGRLGVTVSFY